MSYLHLNVTNLFVVNYAIINYANTPHKKD
jgi:hypothetical protein